MIFHIFLFFNFLAFFNFLSGLCKPLVPLKELVYTKDSTGFQMNFRSKRNKYLFQKPTGDVWPCHGRNGFQLTFYSLGIWLMFFFLRKFSQILTS